MKNNLPATFGGVAQTILSILCTIGKRIDFVCDVYQSPSLKDNEHEKRGLTDVNIKITGADQKWPKYLQKALHSSNFKKEFLLFLAHEWGDERYADIVDGHEIYIGKEMECYMIRSENNYIVKSLVPQLESQHEEADTRIIWSV